MNLKTRRMNHIFKEDGKALIVAMDHGTFNGAAPGLEHPGETLQQIAEGGADAVLCNFGVARKFAKELAPLGYIARLDLPPTYMGQGHDSRLVFDAEYALRMGADASRRSADMSEEKKLNIPWFKRGDVDAVIGVFFDGFSNRIRNWTFSILIISI